MADTLTLVTARERATRRRRFPVLTIISASVLGLIVLASVLAPIVAPYDPAAQSPDRLVGLGGAHLLGTDELGRDLLSRILFGGQLTIFIALGATVLAMLLGLVWGMAAAFLGGWLDELLMRLADTVMAIPQILFALVFVSAFGADPVKLAVIVGILLTPTTARLVRSSVLSELKEDYFTAAVAFGASRPRLVLTEVLPNVRGAIVVQAAINAANAILLEASLSFVGLGIAPPEATWGTLVQQGYQKMYQSIGYVIFPALFIFVTIWLLNVLADQLGAGEKKGVRR
ncbi:ABC transporter permease [Microbacterium nymphoidis]|uniref:ABC transporter permease n=1 Tax=Microbacterium nymphoidis TaxID=2898586 RepID=UPI001E4474EC|nr:ABC transporter permease [Microbacterium nymphoidis]MCD2499538.1 ABC transporter permease [Microbacterium nymphoidis]